MGKPRHGKAGIHGESEPGQVSPAVKLARLFICWWDNSATVQTLSGCQLSNKARGKSVHSICEEQSSPESSANLDPAGEHTKLCAGFSAASDLTPPGPAHRVSQRPVGNRVRAILRDSRPGLGPGHLATKVTLGLRRPSPPQPVHQLPGVTNSLPGVPLG